MTADVLADWSSHVLIHSTWMNDLVRSVILVFAGLTSALLLRLYTTHRTGRMNRWAGIGAMLTYASVSWAQIINLTKNPSDDLQLFSVGVLIAVTCSLVGTLQTMDVRLFRRD